MLFEPEEKFQNRFAYFEMDMDIISVPVPVFETNIRDTFLKIFETAFVDCQARKCAILRSCDTTMNLIDSWLKEGNQYKRFKIKLENNVVYHIPVTSLFRQREKNQRIQCDFMI